MDAAALAERLTTDAEKLIRLVLSPPEGRGLHSLTTEVNLSTFGTHRSRYSST
jgi:hypothetical protein